LPLRCALDYTKFKPMRAVGGRAVAANEGNNLAASRHHPSIGLLPSACSEIAILVRS